jgi:hypothetical protein
MIEERRRGKGKLLHMHEGRRWHSEDGIDNDWKNQTKGVKISTFRIK